MTHQVQLLKDAQKILVLDEGKIVERGSYSEINNIDKTSGDQNTQSSKNSEVDASQIYLTDESKTLTYSESSSEEGSKEEQKSSEVIFQDRLIHLPHPNPMIKT